MRPLENVRVVELDDLGLAQFGGKLLADLGADVVKVEPPEGVSVRHVPPFYGDEPGPDRSLHFWYYNGSKRSVIQDPEGADSTDVLHRLLASASVVLDGSGGSTSRQLGLTASELEAAYPHLIYCRVTPFGTTGPWADYQGSDLVHLALGGVMAACGYDNVPGAPPIAPSGGQAHHLVGIAIATGVLSALVRKLRTGGGTSLDIAVHDVVSTSTEMSFAYWEYQRANPRRQTGRHARPYDSPPWNHPCRDGKYFCTLPLYLDDQRFAAMVAWFAEKDLAEDLADDPYTSREGRADRMDHIVSVIRGFCARHDSAYLFREAQKRRLPWAPVNLPPELLGDPHLEARGAFQDVRHDDLDRTFTYPGAPYRFSHTSWGPMTRAPLLGEHTDEVLAELASRTQERRRGGSNVT
jgi:crotonobetainyl-CoA:carnitine CoA-transferase CaiB-like acyl-CoA transferase